MTFESQTNEFSLTNALMLARASRLAYEPEAAVLEKIKSWEMKGKFLDSPTNTQAFVAYDSQKVIVSFRGTEGKQLTDWLVNADTNKTQTLLSLDEKLGVCYDVHTGFYYSIRSVWKELLLFIEQSGLNDRPIWFTGHSLGGAIAVLAAIKWQEYNKLVQGVYTFGCPRIGGTAFFDACKERLSGRIFRFVNNNDLVPRIPLFLTGYMHVGQLFFFDKEGKLFQNYSTIQVIADFFKELAGKFVKHLRGSIKDHSMDTYISLIEKLPPAEIRNSSKLPS